MTDDSTREVGWPPRSAPEVVAPTSRVNVALPFSKISVQEPSKELAVLAAIVAELAVIVEGLAPAPAAEALRKRARVLANRTG